MRSLRMDAGPSTLETSTTSVAHTLEYLAEHGLGCAAAVTVGGVEIVDAAIEGVMDQVLLAGPEPTRAKGYVGDLETRPPELAIGLLLCSRLISARAPPQWTASCC